MFFSMKMKCYDLQDLLKNFYETFWQISALVIVIREQIVNSDYLLLILIFISNSHILLFKFHL